MGNKTFKTTSVPVSNFDLEKYNIDGVLTNLDQLKDVIEIAKKLNEILTDSDNDDTNLDQLISEYNKNSLFIPVSKEEQLLIKIEEYKKQLTTYLNKKTASPEKLIEEVLSFIESVNQLYVEKGTSEDKSNCNLEQKAPLIQ